MACMCARIVSLSAAYSMNVQHRGAGYDEKDSEGFNVDASDLGGASQEISDKGGASGRQRAHKLGAADLDQRLMHRARDFEAAPLRCDHRVDHPCRDFVERASSQRGAIRFNGNRHLHEITLEHSADERLPVGEILVERADRHARPLGDASGRQFSVADR
jgi:hypothetical protein